VAKDEPSSSSKGKFKLELPNFEELSVEEIHQGYLTRLSLSQDAGANMINMLKRRYEV
jgi:hypothetical protein